MDDKENIRIVQFNMSEIREYMDKMFREWQRYIMERFIEKSKGFSEWRENNEDKKP